MAFYYPPFCIFRKYYLHISQFNFIFCSRPTTGLQQNLVATRCTVHVS
nr:MAG TPA: hypothetical protein [Caudoviricetes sp.]DAG86431.1 MAG TPA: hypothetical protein [Caudoviricetes sp.]DAH04485.1 MAG TPA: hypothetical protein [Caudoviricetes sp.]